ncbi:MAG: BON domain-containing protein [Myxococcales bacterium]|nr:BON domain-containing protein [Myxococcales bacterium]MCB9670614.1 BON domain-containing protein [Alphaproteobacteria bacterium]
MLTMLCTLAFAGPHDDTIAATLGETIEAHHLGADVALEVRDGRVELIGRVPDTRTHDELLAAARGIDGVVRVVDTLEVQAGVEPGLPGSFTVTAPKSRDTGAHDRLLKALQDDLEAADIDTAGVALAYEGETLVASGRVSTRAEKRTVQRIVSDRAPDAEIDLAIVK